MQHIPYPPCPRCGGHYGGFDTRPTPNGIEVTNIWRCHCDVNGGGLSLLEWLPGAMEPTFKPAERKPGKACGWVGVLEKREDA